MPNRVIDPIDVLKDIAEDCQRRLRKGYDNGDASTLSKCLEAIESGKQRANPLAVDLPPLLRFPSSESAGYDIQAFIPVEMAFGDALAMANQVIYEANKQDNDSGGEGCLDGLCVQESIQSRLCQLGFRFVEAQKETTMEWDSFDPNPPSMRPRG